MIPIRSWIQYNSFSLLFFKNKIKIQASICRQSVGTILIMEISKDDRQDDTIATIHIYFHNLLSHRSFPWDKRTCNILHKLSKRSVHCKIY